jgi:mono/diheme cytochrome c family protein
MTKYGAKLLLATIVVATSVATRAQEADLGKSEFHASCATCHGTDGKGKGPFSEYLKVDPADLTVLSRKNGGVFPLSEVYDAIYGIKTIVTHGTRDMPIWGYRYMLDSNKALYPKPSDSAMNLPYDPEAVVRTRVLAVIDYLNRIQQK